MHNNSIRDRGAAAAIGNNTTWIQLKKIDLNNNQIGYRGAHCIAQNISWKKLTELIIHSNEGITEGGKKSLRKNSIFGLFVDV